MTTDLDMLPDPELQEQMDSGTAYAVSGALTFAGLPLFPSRRRMAVAQALGNRILSGVARLGRDGCYPGMEIDAAVTLWVCSMPEGEAMKALLNPVQALEMALEWAERMDCLLEGKRFEEACSVYATILLTIFASRFKVTKEAGSKKKPQGHPVVQRGGGVRSDRPRGDGAKPARDPVVPAVGAGAANGGDLAGAAGKHHGAKGPRGKRGKQRGRAKSER